MSLSVKNLTGGYSRIPVLKNITFDIKDGELVGLIGLNGAGKSTTIKHIMGLLDPFEGEISLNGKTLRDAPNEYRTKIGFIPETPVLYDELTLREHIEITAMAFGVDQELAFKRAEHLLELFRLTKRMEWFPSDFSKGMRQKVMIVCAFIVDPDLFIIDEPFVGLDPLAIRDLIQLIEEQKRKGSSILMSTHVLANAERICDRFIIIDEGEIYAQGTLEELRAYFNMPNATLDEMYGRLADREGFAQ